MLMEYRDQIAPTHIGHRPKRLFVNPDGTPKAQATVAYLICKYAQRRAGIELTPHQFRHLGAKIMLDANPGNFAGVGQLLGHKNSKTTMMYPGSIPGGRVGTTSSLSIKPLSARCRRRGENTGKGRVCDAARVKNAASL
jgi:integrase